MLSASNSSLRQECVPGKNTDGRNVPANSKRVPFIPPGFQSRLDALMAVIRFGPSVFSTAEFLVLLFHVERSLPYGKEADATSLSQIVDGIRQRDGAAIRGGCGLKASSAKEANAALEQKGILIRTRRDSSARGHEPTEYRIDWDVLRTALDSSARHETTKPLAADRPSPLATKRPHRDQSSQSRLKQSVPPPAIGAAADGVGEKRRTTTSKQETDPKNANPEPPEQALARMYQEREGRPMPQSEWWSLRQRLELRGITLGDFVGLVLANQGNWRSFPAALRYLERQFSTKSSPMSIDATPSPQEPRPRCPECGQSVGEGVRIQNGQLVPCACATEAWRAKLAAANERDQIRKQPGRAVPASAAQLGA